MSIDLGSAFGRVLLDANEALDTTDKLGRGLSGLAGPAAAMGGAIVAAGAVAGGALVALGASSVGVAKEFESSMAIMSTAVDPLSVGAQTTAEAMDILGDASLAVGGDTSLVGVSASTAAEAMTGLYKAGLSTGEIFGDLQGYMSGTAELSGALRASIDLAAASELDMVQASELAAITLATFGGHLETEAERAEFINSAMNNFVQTADGSVASVQDLADAFVNVGSTAAGMGIPLEDMNTALGILSTRGIAGAEAGTAFKSMLTNMMTAPKAAEALDDLGVSLYDVNGQMRPLEAIVRDLEGAMAGMTDEQRTQTTVALASSYGQKALNALLAEGADGWAAMEGAIGDAATMEETAAARTNTLAGAQEALSGVWESFRIKVGTALVPVLTQLADVGARLIEKYGPTLTAIFETVGEVLGNLFDNLEEGMSPMDAFIEAIWDFAPQPVLDALVNFRDNILPGIQSAFQSVVDAVGPFVQEHGPLLLKILGGLVVAFGAFSIISTVVGWIGGLVGAISGIGAAITAAGGGIAGLIAILGGPLTLVVGAIAGAIGLFAVAWKNDWGGIQGKVQEVIAFLQPLVQGWLSGLSAWWSATWPQLQATLQTVWGVIQNVIQSAIAVIWPAIQNFIGSLAPVWEQLKGLWPSLVGLWEAAKPVLLGVLSVIGAALVTLVGLASGVINGLSQALGPLIQGIIGAVQGIIRVFTGVFQTLQGLFRLIVGLFTGNTELMRQAWQNLKDGVTNIVGGLVDGIVSLIGGLVKGVIGFISGLVEGVIGFFTNLYNRLVGHSIVTDLVERIQSLWEWLWSGVERVLKAAWDIVLGIFEKIGEWINDKLAPWIEFFYDKWVNEWWPEIQGAIEKAWDFIEPIWDAIREWIEDTIPPILDSLRTKFETIMTAISNAVQPVKDIWDGLVLAVQGFWDWIKDKVFNFSINLPDLPDWAKPGSPLPIHTAWSDFANDIASIGRRIANGFLQAFANIEDHTERTAALFDTLGSLAGLGGGFGGLFQSGTLDPLQANLDATADKLSELDGALADIADIFGIDSTAWNFQSELLRLMNYEFSSPAWRDAARVGLAFLEERSRLLVEQSDLQRELEAQQARLARLEEQRAQIGFLQQQLDLLNLIRENELDTSILEGLTLGLGADPGALMDAMTAAIRQMIQAAEDELGIASASKVMRRIAAQAKEGLIVEMAEHRGVVKAARGMVSSLVDAAEFALGGIGGGAVDSSRRMTLYGGQHFYFQQRRGSVLDEMQGLLAP